MAIQLKKQNGIYIALIAAAIVALIAAVAHFWQKSYLTLPEPEVVPSVERGVEAPAVAAGLDKFDILLLGLDSREGEPELGDRSDTILLVNIDAKEYYASVLSIPRDTRVRYEGKWHKINEVFGIDGAEGSVKAVEELLAVSIDRYAVVDFHGVIDLVDLFGGIVVDVPKDMYKPLENIDLKKGEAQHLNGYGALAYMRYRDEILSDMDRSERQKEVLLQLADKLLQPANLLRLPTLVGTALTYVKTNMGIQEILTLAKYGRTILNNGVDNRVLPGVNDLYLGGWYYVPFLEELGLPVGEAEEEYRAYLAQQAAEEQAKERERKEQALARETTETPDSQETPEGQEWPEGAGETGHPEETGGAGFVELPETTVRETAAEPGGIAEVGETAIPGGALGVETAAPETEAAEPGGAAEAKA